MGQLNNAGLAYLWGIIKTTFRTAANQDLIDAAKADADDLTFVTPEMYGAYGDGTHDDTIAIQRAFNSTAKEIRFALGKTYLVSKTTNATLYPDNDAPCVYIHTQSHKVINGNGATLKVNKHGQGVMEIVASDDIVVRDLGFEGYGASHTPAFPAIKSSGTGSGLGEKGGENGGYYKSGYDWESHKNNSVDTSNYEGVDGNSNTSWGTFGNGYIGNVGIGLLIEDGCSNIRVENCRSCGFNYSGFSVGFRGHTSAAYNSNIVFDNCHVWKCYDDGINLLLADGVTVQNCLIENIGHPDALPADETVAYAYEAADPGYGVCCRSVSSGSYRAKNVKVLNNRIQRCVRKGVDSHSVDGYTITGNQIRICYAEGIDLAGGAVEARQSYDVIIAENTLEYCGLEGHGINYYIYTGNASFDPNGFDANAIIANNILRKCTCSNYGILNVRCGRNVKLLNNIISDVWLLGDVSALQAIYIGQAEKACEAISCIGNNVSIRNQKVAYPIRYTNLKNSVICDNVVNVSECSAMFYGAGTLANNVNIIGNTLHSDTYVVDIGYGVNSGAVSSNIVSGTKDGSTAGSQTGTQKAFLINATASNGYYRFENDFIKASSIIVATPVYTYGGAVNLVFRLQPGDGFVGIYAYLADGTALNGTLICSLAVFN